ncbi:MAG: hypothetical protein HQK59_05725 [Deltaproteobacteria bacterium]|nr:hypothetical protein [Deltaproteobacteria bacterium]
MGAQTEQKGKAVLNQQEKYKEAEESLKKMLEEIAPFLPKEERKDYSTAGKWVPSSSLVR